MAFERLKFCDGEEEEFKKYTELKGIYLHKQVYDILLEYDAETVTYYEMSSVVRYDKNLRDKLYVYLATFEEYLRSVLFNKYDVKQNEIRYEGMGGLKKLREDCIEKQDADYSNLYYKFKLDLGKTIDLMTYLGIYDHSESTELNEIRELRNNVMHHNLLILGDSATKHGAEENISKLQKQIETLCGHLPEEYREHFASDINELNIDPKTREHYLNKLCLEEIGWKQNML